LKKTLSLSLLDKQIRNEDTEEVGGEGIEDMCTEGRLILYENFFLVAFHVKKVIGEAKQRIM